MGALVSKSATYHSARRPIQGLCGTSRGQNTFQYPYAVFFNDAHNRQTDHVNLSLIPQKFENTEWEKLPRGIFFIPD